jgi:hypothetical protein
MKVKGVQNTTLKCEGESYRIVIREVDFINGYKLVKLLVNSRRCWAINDSDSWRLMSDYPISGKLRAALLKKIDSKNAPRLRVVHRSSY